MSCLFASQIGRFIRDTYTIKNCLLRNCSAFSKILPNDTVPNLSNSPSYRHKPVFVKEVVKIINPAGGQVYNLSNNSILIWVGLITYITVCKRLEWTTVL